MDADDDDFGRGIQTRMTKALSSVENMSELARRSGVGRRMLDRYRAGMEPSLSNAARICQAAGWSLDEIALGMNVSPKPFGGFGESSQPPLFSDVVDLPVLNVLAAAGPGAWNERAEVVAHVPFSLSTLRQMGIDPGRVHGIRSRGDSMWPTISDGAIMLVNTGEREIVGDYIWSLVVGDEARVKRVQKLLDGSFSLISDNKDRYPPERLDRADAESMEIVGRVFWTEKVL